MGHKEVSYLYTLNHSPMADHSTTVRSVLLNRNHLDSPECVKQTHQRKSKSQQVRFKEESTNKKKTNLASLDAKSSKNTPVVNGKVQMPRHHNPLQKSHKGLKNIAIQTSPSLRKHFPIFKRKKQNTSKSVMVSVDSACSTKLNGIIHEKDNTSTDVSHLTLIEHMQDRTQETNIVNQILTKTSKTQSNGPVIHCSESKVKRAHENSLNLNKVPKCNHRTYAQESKDFTHIASTCETSYIVQHSSRLVSRSQEHCTQCSHTPSKNNETNSSHITHKTDMSNSKHLRSTEYCNIKDTSTDTHQLGHSSSECKNIDSDDRPMSEVHSDSAMETNNSQAAVTQTGNEECNSVNTNQNEVQQGSSQADCLQTKKRLEALHLHTYFPRKERRLQTSNKTQEINQIHIGQGELCELQRRLKFIEDSLQSNQEKIKVLLNVIHDMEKAKALSDGRNFYRTGQDLNNCSTCQSTACIIYRI
ncbi:protein INSYN2B isoform X2 [Protopterus annectens]|uniref:protein INSYN2B isoform X2 n=1 Tax=Protopterus annectens TaxID=7888 RepID=UPI001CFA2A68|nr:protein INSYN2B isoform X2 [Protopterus annectens]